MKTRRTRGALVVTTFALALLAAFGVSSASAGICDPHPNLPIYGGGGFKGQAYTLCDPPGTQMQICLQNNSGLGWSGQFACNTVSDPTGGQTYYSQLYSASCGFNVAWRTSARFRFSGGSWGAWQNSSSYLC